MRMRTYKLYGTGTADANAIATLTITRAGRIRSVNISLNAVAGAATNATLNVEVALNQSAAMFTTNDTPDGVLAYCSLGFPIASAAQSANSFAPCSHQVQAGDRLYMHLNVDGTAVAAGGYFIAMVSVEEP